MEAVLSLLGKKRSPHAIGQTVMCPVMQFSKLPWHRGIITQPQLTECVTSMEHFTVPSEGDHKENVDSQGTAWRLSDITITSKSPSQQRYCGSQ